MTQQSLKVENACSRFKLQPGGGAAHPLHLYVFCADDENAAQSFAEELTSFSVSTAPQGDAAKMDFTDPRQEEDQVTGVSRISDLFYSVDTGTNDISWDLSMKNGDMLHLQTTFTCEPLPVAEYHYEDTPLETVDDIYAVIDEVMASDTPDAIIYLFLPPVVYTDPLILDKRPVTVFGSMTDAGQTTFSGGVKIPMRGEVISEFYDTAFEGNGGTGLAATESVWLTNCRFDGWDVGADCREGAWICMQACDFTNNGVGFRFNSENSSSSCPTYENMYFAGNDTAVQVRHIPGGDSISFENCKFENNSTDLDDTTGSVSVIN